MEFRMEKDSMGQIAVPSNKYWGAQTQRSLENFKIGSEKMPLAVVRALAAVKLASARVNRQLLPLRMTAEKLAAIEAAAGEILAGALDAHFPLAVWQTGSGTQTNMNVNEVIANRSNALAGKKLLHPNDDVNMSQSSNDTFPTAMHLCAVTEVEQKLLPAVDQLIATLLRLEQENKDAYKTGRTHLEDATPITFGQEISGWRASLEKDRQMILQGLQPLRGLALGATAVGTGLNAPEGFSEAVAAELSAITGTQLHTEENKFHALTSKAELVFAHGGLKALAADLMKMANDIRWLASGPRCGLGEINIPENEPGSSIMPGKVNPTQCEAVTMVAVQVMGNDAAVGIAASQGNFQLNVFMPVILNNFLQSVTLLADVMVSFDQNCVSGITANKEKMRENLDRSLMTVTGLTPLIGYENAAKVVHKAHKEGLSLKEATLSLGYMTADAFDQHFRPEEMAKNR